MNSPRQLDLWKSPVPLYFFMWLILTVTTFSHTTGKFLTSISIQAYSKHLRVLFSRKKYLRVDILFFPFFTGYAWAKLWKRLGRHFQLYLGLMYLWILCWQWYHLQQLGPKLFYFLFFQKNRGLPETCLAYSLFNVHIAGIHSNFVRERGTESNHVYQPIFSFLI